MVFHPFVVSFEPPRIISHRGASGYAPENTLVSLRKAADLGARWVEFDVHLTRDNVAILLHDDTLDRTTNGHGPIQKMNWRDLAELDAGNWYSPAFAGEPVPELGAVIELLGELGLGANLEIKPSPGAETITGFRVAEQLRSEWPEHLPPPLLSSFRIDSLHAARAAAPEIDRALLVTGIPGDWEQRMQTAECTAIHCDHAPLTPDRVGEILSSGYALRCYTVNDPDRAQDLLSWGVDSIITDFPDRIAAQEPSAA